VVLHLGTTVILIFLLRADLRAKIFKRGEEKEGVRKAKVEPIKDKKLISKLKFIKEGSFKEKGWPTLKLIGDVKICLGHSRQS